MKRFLALLLSLLMLVSLAACSEDGSVDNSSKTDKSEKAEDAKDTFTTKDRYVFPGTSATRTDVGTPENTLDPQSVYASLTYTPEMFYGDYSIVGGDTAEDAFAAEASYTTRIVEGEELELSTLPFRIRAGRNSMSHRVNDIEGYNWMELYYMKKYGDSEPVLTFFNCAYTVEGSQLKLTPFETYEVDSETQTISYSLAAHSWEYTFSFRGRELTLSDGTDSITLLTGLDAYKERNLFSCEGYLSPNSRRAANLECIFLYGDSNDSDSSFLVVNTPDGDHNYESVAALEENGLLTITVVTEEEDQVIEKTSQFVYFYCGEDGWVLTDGTNIYNYNLSYYDYSVGSVSKFLTVDMSEKAEDLSQSQLEAIVEKTRNLLDDLAAAYEDAGLRVVVNHETGEIALDTTVLFGVNETEISDEGKTFLKQFLQVYTSVVFSETYDDFVSGIMVEGHTDTNGSYEYNMTLSQARADSVKAYCLSADCGADNVEGLQTMMQAVGYSYDKPIYNDAGEVDMDASRRVSFRFLINLDNA